MVASGGQRKTPAPQRPQTPIPASATSTAPRAPNLEVSPSDQTSQPRASPPRVSPPRRMSPAPPHAAPSQSSTKPATAAPHPSGTRPLTAQPRRGQPLLVPPANTYTPQERDALQQDSLWATEEHLTHATDMSSAGWTLAASRTPSWADYRSGCAAAPG